MGELSADSGLPIVRDVAPPERLVEVARKCSQEDLSKEFQDIQHGRLDAVAQDNAMGPRELVDLAEKPERQVIGFGDNR